MIWTVAGMRPLAIGAGLLFVGTALATAGCQQAAPAQTEVVPTSADSPGNASASPIQSRLVGASRAVLAVPAQWDMNATRCGVAERDTVIVDDMVAYCSSPQPANVDSVTLRRGIPAADFRSDREYRLAEYTVLRQDVGCSGQADSEVQLCRGSLYVQDLDVSFAATSTRGPEFVDALLDGVQIATDSVGVLGVQGPGPDPSGTSEGEAHAARLKAIGLAPRVVASDTSQLPSGRIVQIIPAPGTVVSVDSEVTVVVSAGRG